MWPGAEKARWSLSGIFSFKWWTLVQALRWDSGRTEAGDENCGVAPSKWHPKPAQQIDAKDLRHGVEAGLSHWHGPGSVVDAEVEQETTSIWQGCVGVRGSLGVVHSLFGPDCLQISIDALMSPNRKYSHRVATCWIHACSNENKTETPFQIRGCTAQIY